MKKSQEEQQKWDPSSMMDRHAIVGMCTEQTTVVKYKKYSKNIVKYSQDHKIIDK